jgi:hypothetical protein
MEVGSMRLRPWGISLAILLLVASALDSGPVSAEGGLEEADFTEESWSKALDLMQYAREHAEEHGRSPPPEDWSADLRLNYVNLHGVKLLYAGFEGATFDRFNLTVPLQSFVESFRTRDGLDAVTASTFLMVLAYNETEGSLFPDSPDRNDLLWGAFNIGRDLTEFFGGDAPSRLSGGVEVTPLTHSEDKHEWEWGMTYTNLTAVWWALELDEDEPGYSRIPVAFCVYDELSFDYRLIFDPVDGEADLHLSYTIGEMRDLWILQWKGILPMLLHYSDDGCYLGRNIKLSNETIYDFLRENRIEISLVMFQRNIVVDHSTSSAADGENVTDASVDVSSTSIETVSDTGEKIFEIDFGAKDTYNLHNSTSGVTSVHDAVTRTSEIESYARNPVIEVQTSLLRFLPYVIKGMAPEGFQGKADELLNVTRVDYLYATSYPVFEGYRIEHDPVLTAFYERPEPTDGGPGGLPMAFIYAGLILFGVAAILALIRRR